MKDERIKYRPAERQALIDHGVRAFCLTSGNLTAQAMANCFIRVAVGSTRVNGVAQKLIETWDGHRWRRAR
jgi:PIN like domain